MTKSRGFTHDDKNNKSVDWYTPCWLFDALGLRFDLDPCQPKAGIPWIPATIHYWEEIDGLALPWFGRVWLNPPYGSHSEKWLEKMHHHRNGVALQFARTDTRWFHDYAAKADALLFLRGRVAFVDGLNATKGSGAGAGSVLIAWGPDCVAALRSMQHLGLFMQPIT